MNQKQNIRIYSIVFILLFLNIVKLHAQNSDSLELFYDRLTWEDIKNDQSLAVATKVISGSRSEKRIKDLPFPIFIITKEEIQQNGYITLVDALKRLPGIRVSQPGSAIDGETFMMRGLLGNTYAKILINDVPIKPFLVRGMPIGAQLPIREAERIEVIYGPVATLYGADASAGVINIIMKNSERPIYVQADLGLGALGFRNLDIMFGGKVGKDDRILSFKVFGNYTSYENRNVFYDIDSLYNPQNYERFWRTENFSYLERPNYLGDATNTPLNNLPHLSNSVGVDLNFKEWTLSFMNMYRRDHSSIGLSPMAVSYSNPLNFYGERINSARLSFNKDFEKFRITSSLNALFYRTDERNSTTHVLPGLAIAQFTVIDTEGSLDSLTNFIDQRYYSGTRFNAASSLELETEVLLSYTINKYVELAGGLSLRGGRGVPFFDYSRVPIIGDIDPGSINNIEVNRVSYLDRSAFLESYINYGKWNAIIGGQIFSRRNNYAGRQLPFLNPRVAAQYQWSDNFSIRSSISRSYRYPSPYYAANSFTIDLSQPQRLETGAELTAEQTYNFEFGSRFNINSKFSGDVSFFYNRTTDFIALNARLIPTPPIPKVVLGYFNDESSFTELYGVQSRFIFSDLVPSIELDMTLNVNYTRGKEFLQNFTFGVDGETYNLTLDGLRSQPDWIVQLDMKAKPHDKFSILLEHTFMTSSLRQYTTFLRREDLEAFGQLRDPGFYTLDLNLSYQVNRQLLTFCKINNVFSKKYAGIGSLANIDGLFYNPQMLRFLRVGVNYRLE